MYTDEVECVGFGDYSESNFVENLNVVLSIRSIRSIHQSRDVCLNVAAVRYYIDGVSFPVKYGQYGQPRHLR